MKSDDAPIRFRLSFVNAAEDVPRLIRAYGRACLGQFALALRPTERRATLVLIPKGKGQQAVFWRQDDGHDAPQVPTQPTTPTQGIKLIRGEQTGLPRQGAISLKGEWSGYLYCDDGAPRVELARKIASYGVLRITSDAKAATWTWRVDRAHRWFSKARTDAGTAPTLLGAIEAGLAAAMDVLGEACSVRDSRRRAALDEAHAAKHPNKPAREGKDPTERLKEPRASKASAPGARDASPATSADTSTRARTDGSAASRSDASSSAARDGKTKTSPRGKGDAKPTAPKKAPTTKASTKAPAADAAKDQQLLDLFTQAIASAVEA